MIVLIKNHKNRYRYIFKNYFSNYNFVDNRYKKAIAIFFLSPHIFAVEIIFSDIAKEYSIMCQKLSINIFLPYKILMIPQHLSSTRTEHNILPFF